MNRSLREVGISLFVFGVGIWSGRILVGDITPVTVSLLLASAAFLVGCLVVRYRYMLGCHLIDVGFWLATGEPVSPLVDEPRNTAGTPESEQKRATESEATQ